jgi:ATP-dependent Zn protease
MDLKRIFRSWMLVILLVFVLLVVVLKFTGSNQYRVVQTSQVMKLVTSGQVKSAILNVPTQVVQVTTTDNHNLEATWVGNQDNQIASALQGSGISYDVKNPQGNSLLNVLLVVVVMAFAVGVSPVVATPGSSETIHSRGRSSF